FFDFVLDFFGLGTPSDSHPEPGSVARGSTNSARSPRSLGRGGIAVHIVMPSRDHTFISTAERDTRMAEESRPPLPPFTYETAAQKVRMAEDAWNSRDPARVSLAYSVDSVWRNRAEFVNGREEIVAFLQRK